MARICKKIGFAILSFALSLWVVMAGFFPAVLPKVSAHASTALTYEQTDVMDDFPLPLVPLINTAPSSLAMHAQWIANFSF